MTKTTIVILALALLLAAGALSHWTNVPSSSVEFFQGTTEAPRVVVSDVPSVVSSETHSTRSNSRFCPNEPATRVRTSRVPGHIGDVTDMVCTITAYCTVPEHTILPPERRVGTAAVDPRVIPYGSKLVIDRKTYRAIGRHGKNGRVIDVWLSSRHDCMRFGRKRLRVKVVPPIK